MSSLNAEVGRNFYRDADRAMLGGVCAGLAGYLGFNLRMTRILAFIAFLMAMPIAVVAYLAAVFLVPAESTKGGANTSGTRRTDRRWSCRKARKREEQEEARTQPSPMAAVINSRCQSMDERLALLEKHVTSRRFQIDQELGRL